MRFLVDMNLSPEWEPALRAGGYEAIHWSKIGARNDEDVVIFDWAIEHDYVILTLDLDFGTLLAITGSTRPSVIQIRREDASPAVLLPILIELLRTYSYKIEEGALVVLDETKIRLRMLPLAR